jgi:hypothetical protein
MIIWKSIDDEENIFREVEISYKAGSSLRIYFASCK